MGLLFVAVYVYVAADDSWATLRGIHATTSCAEDTLELRVATAGGVSDRQTNESSRIEVGMIDQTSGVVKSVSSVPLGQ